MTEPLARLFRADRRNKSETIADGIERLVAEQRLQPGDRLPSERELMAAFGAALGTVRQALLLLERRGLVQRRSRSGTFYSGQPPAVESAPPPATATSPQISPPDSAPVLSIFTHTTQTITFYAKELGHDACRRRWEAFADWASQSLPGTRLALRHVAADSLVDAVRALGPDIVLATERELNDLAAAHHVLPIPRRAAPWFDPADFFACSHHALGSADTLRGIPYFISAGLKIWNDELLRLAGGALPERATAPLLRPLLDNLAGQAREAVAVTFIHMPLYQWLEDGILVWNPATGACELDRAAAADSLAFNRRMYRRLYDLVASPPSASRSLNPFAVWRAFPAGHVLVMDTFSYSLGHLPEPPRFPLRVQAPPRFPGPAVAAHTSLLALTPACVDRERAIDFLRLAASPEGQTRFARSLHNIPARREIARSPAYLGACPPGMAAVLDALDEAESVFHRCPLLTHLPLEGKALDAALACYHGDREAAATVEILAGILRLMTGTPAS